ncbi:MAG: tol-pal system-associated acyl-CoA thioesterase [Thauera sp.]|nr:tol-pal system-associated acyl-CoA thioesterase [Thauera sp.]
MMTAVNNNTLAAMMRSLQTAGHMACMRLWAAADDRFSLSRHDHDPAQASGSGLPAISVLRATAGKAACLRFAKLYFLNITTVAKWLRHLIYKQNHAKKPAVTAVHPERTRPASPLPPVCPLDAAGDSARMLHCTEIRPLLPSLSRIRHHAHHPFRLAVFSLPLRVYYEDTDAAGVVYYANYLRFCERARTELLRQSGVEQQALMRDQGIAFVVRSVQADYLQPARLDDSLQVSTQVAKLRRVSVLFEQQIHRDDVLLFSARTLVACIDHRRQKPCVLPADLLTLFESTLLKA